MRDCASREVALVLVGEVLKADYFGGRLGKSRDFPSSLGAGGDFLPLIMKKPQEQFAVWLCPTFDGTPGKVLWLGFVEMNKEETTSWAPKGQGQAPIDSLSCRSQCSCIPCCVCTTGHFALLLKKPCSFFSFSFMVLIMPVADLIQTLLAKACFHFYTLW